MCGWHYFSARVRGLAYLVYSLVLVRNFFMPDVLVFHPVEASSLILSPFFLPAALPIHDGKYRVVA